MKGTLGLLARAALVVMVAGLCLALGVHAYQDWQALHRPLPVRQGDTSRIQPWMTVGFIARTHGVPVPALASQLGAPHANVTLVELARQRGVPVPAEVDEARRAVAALRATQPTPDATLGPRPPPPADVQGADQHDQAPEPPGQLGDAPGRDPRARQNPAAPGPEPP